MNIPALKIIVAELNHIKVIENPDRVFEINFDKSGDLVVDWSNRKVRALVKNLARELGLDYHTDFRLGHTHVNDLPVNISTPEKIREHLTEALADYIEIAELFIK